ncbi:GNAT family N-acetyltransferase [Kocuria tytonicola]|uniref:GNAT family N-acetyltransferase n=1 Tax=Kocuria tytonicola TaxID=2055946 RepID=A0A3L9KXS2_9MICC|nr:GNAT family N-acetyltransferase [Kocuria tytonicola]RLY91150.1 GNAT family N-acetyltransferase [Kocuria tytonicola]RLZ03045.1 GNAT family N-acetyltransferase [Kocuria tytonicola]
MTDQQNSGETSAGQIEVVPAAPADTARAAATLGAAFAVDPHVVGLLPHGDVTASLTRMWERIVRETFGAGGHAYLAVRAGEQQPLGVALWEAPGSKVSLAGMIPGLLTYLRVFRHRVPDALITELLAHRAHPCAPHWYLKAVGTLPDVRGAGVGSLLIRDRLAAVDRQHVGAYLEASTADLVPYYERFGFRSRGPVPSRGTVDALGMWRPPTA